MSAFTAADAREIFNSALAQQTDPDKRAKVELMREYFCNPDFRKALEDEVWRLNNAESKQVRA